MVSKGWQHRASNKPAVPPAIKSMTVLFGLWLDFWDAEDIVCVYSRIWWEGEGEGEGKN